MHYYQQLTSTASSKGAAIPKNIHTSETYGSGRPLDLAQRTTGLIISNEEMKDIMKIVKSG